MNLAIHYRGGGGITLPRPADADWDLIEVYWCDVPRAPSAILDTNPNHRKFHAVAELANAGRLEPYDHVMMCDDDIVPVESVSALFAEFARSGARVAHPALTRDSFFSHTHSLVDDPVVEAFVDVPFTELICPMFTREALADYVPQFPELLYAWGLEQLWAHRERAAGRRVVRLDHALIRHTRPVGQGTAYVAQRAVADCRAFMARYGIT